MCVVWPVKVLLVEDNEVNRTVVRRLLEGMDLDVVEAHDGLQALSALDRESFDLILMDCQMPNLDGYHTTEEIRMGERRLGILIPIIALTAQVMDNDRRRCLESGMDALFKTSKGGDYVFGLASVLETWCATSSS